MVKALPTAAVESSGGGVSTEPPRRSERMLRTRKRSRHASPSSPAPAPAPAPARRRQTGKQRSRTPSQWIYDQEIEGGSVDDAEAEISGATLFYLTEEEILQRHKRLYKKRANMGLALYNKNNPEDIYEFTSMLLTDVCNFMDGGVCYTHINFKARNVTTRSEELFFAELALNNSVVYANSRYSTTACSIVDDNCVGGKRDMLGVEADLPVERFDEKNCYACAEKMKHPTGMTYRGGHYRDDYFVGCESDWNHEYLYPPVTYCTSLMVRELYELVKYHNTYSENYARPSRMCYFWDINIVRVAMLIAFVILLFTK